jgi:transposase
MQTVANRAEAPAAIRTDLGAIFVSLELSRSTWLTGALCATSGETRARTGKAFPFVVIQQAGLDGFWIDRVLQNGGIESHVVVPASIATSRRRPGAATRNNAAS